MDGVEGWMEGGREGGRKGGREGWMDGYRDQGPFTSSERLTLLTN